jgi:hypothetical protein
MRGCIRTASCVERPRARILVSGNPKMLKNRRPAGDQKLHAAGKNMVSATVYLLPDQLQLIKQICADKNRRISDLISDAIDDYLANAKSHFG